MHSLGSFKEHRTIVKGNPATCRLSCKPCYSTWTLSNRHGEPQCSCHLRTLTSTFKSDLLLVGTCILGGKEGRLEVKNKLNSSWSRTWGRGWSLEVWGVENGTGLVISDLGPHCPVSVILFHLLICEMTFLIQPRLHSLRNLYRLMCFPILPSSESFWTSSHRITPNCFCASSTSEAGTPHPLCLVPHGFS